MEVGEHLLQRTGTGDNQQNNGDILNCVNIYSHHLTHRPFIVYAQCESGIT